MSRLTPEHVLPVLTTMSVEDQELRTLLKSVGESECLCVLNEHQIHSSITNRVLYAVDKGLRGRNVLQSLLLILLRICSQSVRPISTK